MVSLQSTKQGLIGAIPAGWKEQFEVVKKLGEGAFGTAHLVKELSTGQRRVLKAMRKNAGTPKAVMAQEVQVLKALDHPNIIRIFGHFEDDRHVYILMEPAEGGELLAVIRQIHIEQRHPLNEAWIAQIFQQCLSAIVYCHDRGVLHKDLKSENIMLLGQNNDSFVNAPHPVVIDFGVAELISPRALSKQHSRGQIQAGTCTTMAPEVWRGDFGPKCDIWSIGCVIYETLSGKLPFLARNLEDASEWSRLHQAGPDMRNLAHVSNDGQQLCKRMLMFDERMRPEAKHCLTHRWFTSPPKTALKEDVLRALCDFQEQSSLGRTLQMHLVSSLNSVDVSHLTEVFHTCDSDKNGTLSATELVSALTLVGLDESKSKQVAQQLLGKGAAMEYSVFLAASLSACHELLDDLLWREFSKFDKDGSSGLSVSELAGVLSSLGFKTEKAAEILAQLDTSGDNQVQFEEFLRYFRRQATPRGGNTASAGVTVAAAAKVAQNAGSTTAAAPSCKAYQDPEIGIAGVLFKYADVDSNGFISQSEFKRWVTNVLDSPELNLGEVDSVMLDFHLADLDGDGILDEIEWDLFIDAVQEVTGRGALERLASAWASGDRPRDSPMNPPAPAPKPQSPKSRPQAPLPSPQTPAFNAQKPNPQPSAIAPQNNTFAPPNRDISQEVDALLDELDL